MTFLLQAYHLPIILGTIRTKHIFRSTTLIRLQFTPIPLALPYSLTIKKFINFKRDKPCAYPFFLFPFLFNSQGKKFGENRTYAYPKVFVGKRSALHEETDKYAPVDFDKKRISKMFDVFPREVVPFTGGKGKYRQKKKPRK